MSSDGTVGVAFAIVVRYLIGGLVHLRDHESRVHLGGTCVSQLNSKVKYRTET